ncbi:hypothetical protein [Salinigranum sp.]|uniref:DUF7546 family protein n=1 Tax=Salinigranum sp. TaxID=1966351 RepID=UPI003564DABB
MSTLSSLFDRGRDLDARGLVLLAGTLVAVELLALGAYFSVSSYSVLSPRYVLYPFVWLNVAVLAVLVADRPQVTGRRRLLASGVGVAYLLVLAWLDGTLGVGTGAGTVRVLWLPPGWGPALLYDGALRVALLPFKCVGYAVLAYLVYGLVADVASAGAGVVGGAVGFFSCVSCTLPVAAAVLSGLVGGSVGVVGATTGAWSYDLSTLAYVVSVGLLTWRPAWTGGRGRGR